MEKMSKEEVIEMFESVRDWLVESAKKEGMSLEDWCYKNIPNNYENE